MLLFICLLHVEVNYCYENTGKTPIFAMRDTYLPLIWLKQKMTGLPFNFHSEIPWLFSIFQNQINWLADTLNNCIHSFK